MASVFPNPLRRSQTGFQLPKVPAGIDLAKVKAALAATAREAGPVAGRQAHAAVATPVKRDFQLNLYTVVLLCTCAAFLISRASGC